MLVNIRKILRYSIMNTKKKEGITMNNDCRFFLCLVLKRSDFKIADFSLIDVFENKSAAFSQAEHMRNKGIDVVLIPLIPNESEEEYLNDIEVEKLYHMFKGIGVKSYCGDSGDILTILRYIE